MGRVLVQQPGTNTARALTETLPKNVIIVDEDLHELRLHDGVTPGGHVIGGGSTGGGYHPNLFDVKWADHILDDAQWLRADTFSWQSGAMYQAAYQHLADDLDGVMINWYAWRYSTTVPVQISRIYTKSSTPSVGDAVFDYQQGETTKTITAVNEGSITVSDGNVYARESSQDITTGGQSETIAGVTITYYLAQDGHKLVLPDQESNVMAIYNATGVAWYYILDTTNQRFKLPRTKFGFTGIRSSVGKFVSAGLPNITANWANLGASASASGAVNVTTRSWGNRDAENGQNSGAYTLNASRSSSIYGNSDTVQPKATEMYLYFYVGNFTQTALENTAGLNTELFNGKAGIDLDNLSTAGQDVCAHMAMPSNRYIDLTLGATGASYTAPADGWFVFGKKSTASGQCIAMSNGAYGKAQIYSSANNQELSQTLPVSKGQSVGIVYTAAGETRYFRFVYANGSK